MRYSLFSLLLVLLAACSGQEQPPSPQSSVPEAAPVAAPMVKLPGGVEFDIASHLRSEKTYKTKKGATRRKVVYELLDATPGEAEVAVTDVLARAGYAGEAPKPGKNGQYSIRYKKAKRPAITVTFYPKLAKKPANPAAKSMVALTWQTKKAPKPKAAVEAGA